MTRDGTVDKLLPEEVIAFFGTPYNDAEHERRAVEAAEETIRKMEDRWTSAPLVAAAVGTGVAFVGNVGQQGSRDYSAVGAIVSLTAAVATEARPGEILVLPEVRAAVGGRSAAWLPRTVSLAGRADPVHVWSFNVSAPAPAEASRRVLATVLFLDLVGSTELAAGIGDVAWRDLLARHYAELRSLLHRWDGTEIDTAGDGLLATFQAPAQAIRFGQDAIAVDRTLGLRTRVGLHTGEVEQVSGTIRGIAVVIAARIGSLAGDGQILVSSTVRELVAGSDLRFEDRGSHVLKGVPEARQVYEVAGPIPR